MGKREEMVEDIVNEVCRKFFDMKRYSEGRDVLYKLYMKEYYKLDNMHTKKNLSFRLIIAERMNNNENAVCNFVKQLKKDMDNTPNYKRDFLADYLDMMSYYTDCALIKLTKKELMDNHMETYEYYKKIYEINPNEGNYLRLEYSKFNLAKLKENFKSVLEVVENLHNIQSERARISVLQIVEEIKGLNNNIYIQSLEIMNTTEKIGCK